jgi:ribosomal protein L7/L12
MYNFANQSDDSLAALSAAIHAEQKRRIEAKMDSYPVPDLNEYNLVELIKRYRNIHGCTLMEARMVVEHHLNKGKRE